MRGSVHPGRLRMRFVNNGWYFRDVEYHVLGKIWVPGSQGLLNVSQLGYQSIFQRPANTSFSVGETISVILGHIGLVPSLNWSFALVVTNIRGVHARNLATKRENLENFWKEMGPPSSPSTTGSPCSKSKVGISSWWRESCHLKYIKEGGFAPPTTCSHLGFATGTSSGGGTGWGPISTFSFPIVF
jgi:hypothetical protein